MLQIATHQAAHHNSRGSDTSVQRAYSELETIADEWASLVDGGNDTRFEELQRLGTELANKIISMPAKNTRDVLSKIAAAGFLMDRKGEKDPLPTWQFQPSGYCCDDAGGVLIMSIRDDLNRLIKGE